MVSKTLGFMAQISKFRDYGLLSEPQSDAWFHQSVPGTGLLEQTKWKSVSIFYGVDYSGRPTCTTVFHSFANHHFYLLYFYRTQ